MTVGMVEMVGTARTMEEMVMEEVMMDYCLQLTIGRARLGTAASHYAARLLRAIFVPNVGGLT